MLAWRRPAACPTLTFRLICTNLNIILDVRRWHAVVDAGWQRHANVPLGSSAARLRGLVDDRHIEGEVAQVVRERARQRRAHHPRAAEHLGPAAPGSASAVTLMLFNLFTFGPC